MSADNYISELEARIQILENENELLSEMSEENILLNKTFEDLNRIDNIDSILQKSLENISILLNIGIAGIFTYFDGKFECKQSYAVFSNNDSLNINIQLASNIISTSNIEGIAFSKIQNNASQFHCNQCSFQPKELAILPMLSDVFQSHYYILFSDELNIESTFTASLLKKIVSIISAKTDRIFYQQELEKLNHNLEIKIKERTLELLKQNKEFESLYEEYKSLNEELNLATNTLETQNAKLTSIIENTKDNIWAFDKDYAIIYTNKAFQDEYKKSFHILIEPGINLLNTLPEIIQPVWKSRYNKVLNGETIIFEESIDTKQGLVYIQVSMNPIIKNGVVIGGACFGSNITERKQMQLKLMQVIIETEEKERTQFASDLHDEIGPMLSSIKMYLSTLEPKENEKQQMVVEKLNELVKSAVKTVRNISNDISPHLLTNHGLHAALVSVIKNTNDFINIKFDSHIENMRFDNNIETTYYRIIKELINNTLKHANAKNIEIELLSKDKQIILIYKDNGIGFDLENTMQQNEKKGMGLYNLIYRAKSIGANYNFWNSPGQGIKFELATRYH